MYTNTCTDALNTENIVNGLILSLQTVPELVLHYKTT